MENKVLANLPEMVIKAENSYVGCDDINTILDLSRFSEDLDGLSEEMLRHPSVYFYWLSLKRTAIEQHKIIEDSYNFWKANKLLTVMELISSSGIKTPTSKLIESFYLKNFSKKEEYIKYQKKINYWKRRIDILSDIEEALSSRDKLFRSLSYLLSNMLSSGLLITKRKTTGG